MTFLADLHIHSRYARATSKNSDLEHHFEWAQYKGLTVIGTGDFTHPAWFAELKEKLEPAEPGLFKLKTEFQQLRGDMVPASCRNENMNVMVTTEISCIYKKNDKVRKVHHLIWAPDLETVAKISSELDKIGNIESDGRPILGMTSKELLQLALDASPDCFFVPAHIWTPWFAVFGSKSGYDTMEEAFEELTPHIYAYETGLSSDPAMNWRLSSLDNLTAISNSDAHSPAKLGRESNEFDTDLSYYAICDAIKENSLEKLKTTIEFFPEEGKYHLDGHRACNVCCRPKETKELDGLCKVCGKPLTVGTLHRIDNLSDRNEEFTGNHNGPEPVKFAGHNRRPFESLIPLPEVIASVFQMGEKSRKVQAEYFNLLSQIGNEMTILRHTTKSNLLRATTPDIAQAIVDIRAGKVDIQPGFDGEYGKIAVSQESLQATKELQEALF